MNRRNRTLLSVALMCVLGLALAPSAIAAGEGSPESAGLSVGRLIELVGRLHVIIVHFPIALLMMAAAGDLMALVSRSAWFKASSRFCVVFGAASAVAAATCGWILAGSVQYTAAQMEVLTQHRRVGVSAGVASIVTLVLMWCARGRESGLAHHAYRAFLYISAALVGAAGHLGGSLIYGSDYFAR